MTTRPSDTYVSFSPSSASIVGRMSVWSVNGCLPGSLSCAIGAGPLSSLRFSIPGPTHPIHVERISGWMPPWFHANDWFGLLTAVVRHAFRSLFAHGVVDDPLRK